MAVNPNAGAQYGLSAAQWTNLTPEQRASYKLNAARSADMSQQLGSLGLTFNGAQVVPMQQDSPMAAPSVPDYGDTGYSAAPATRPLATAPEWLAYLSALGLEESQARADVDRMRSMYQSEAERQKQDLIPQYGQQRRNIAGGMEARGMARSGEYLRRLAESRAQQGRQQAGIEAGLAGQIGQLESNLAQRLGSLATQRAQQELSLRSQGYV